MVRLTLQDDLLESLGRRIVSGHYPPNHLLRTDELETEFNLSRTVVREALKVLESMRLVAIRRALGITVLEQSRWNVFDPRVIRWRLAGPGRDEQLRTLTDLRVAIEPVAAAGAARNATQAQRAELVSLATRLDEALAPGLELDMQHFLAVDIAYHRLLLLASGNEMFAALADVITEVLSAYSASAGADDAGHAGRQKGPRLHIEAAQAILAANPAAAESAMRQILADVNEQIAAE